MSSVASALAGTVKMTQPTAFTTAMLAWGLLSFPKGYASAKAKQQALDQIRVCGPSPLQRTFSVLKPVA